MSMAGGVPLNLIQQGWLKTTFKNLSKSANPTNLESVLNLVDRVVTPNMNPTLLQPYTPDEVKRALFCMHPSKSPWPDGIFPFFFQNFWHIVGRDVTNVVLSILQSSHFLRKMRYTYIVLIPKKNEPIFVSDH